MGGQEEARASIPTDSSQPSARAGKLCFSGRNKPSSPKGDLADALFYIQTGKVKLTVVSNNGKEATIGILGEGDFCGEGSLAGQALRMGSATPMTDCAVLRIDKNAMMEALHQEHEFSDMFVAYLLERNIRHEEDLVDQLFNSSEKRLARILLLLAHFGKEGKPESVVPKDQSGDAGGNDRHHPLAGQLLHEPIQKVGVYSLQWRPTSPQLVAECRPARLKFRRCDTRPSSGWSSAGAVTAF